VHQKAWLIVPFLLVLGACRLPPAHTPPAPTTSTATGSVASSSVSSAPNHLLRLDGAVLTSTGTTRFLETGVLEIGNADAPLTLTVFTEYHCKYCYQFQAEFLPQLQQEFINDGRLKVRYVIKPLQKYPNSLATKQALLCAAKHGKGWPMHVAITSEANRSALALRKHMEGMGIDSEGIGNCATDAQLASQIQLQNEVMDQLEVKLVPTFFLNDEKKIGLPVYPDMRGWIEAALN